MRCERINPATASIVTIGSTRPTKRVEIPSVIETVTVPDGKPEGVLSSLSVNEGESVTVRAQSEWYVGGCLPWVGAMGIKGGVLTNEQQSDVMCPAAAFGSLVAAVGDKYVPVRFGKFVAPASGEVRFLCNDGKKRGDYDDNEGALKIYCWK